MAAGEVASALSAARCSSSDAAFLPPICARVLLVRRTGGPHTEPEPP